MSAPVSDKLKALAAYNPDSNKCPIHLDANESFLELTEELKKNIASRVSALSFNRYPDPLASGVCAAFARRHGISPDFVTAGNGSDELISVLFNDFLGRGDKVMLTSPDFSMYSIYCSLAQAQPVMLGKSGDLSFEPDDMIALAKKSGARMILFSNPCNPTGLGIPAREVLRIAGSVNALVVVDEAYMDFWDESVIGEAPKRENLMVLRTCSKIGFAAARLGFAVGCSELTGYLRAAKSPYNVNSLTQAAGQVLLEEGSYLDNAAGLIRRSRDELYKGICEITGKYPSAAQVFETHTNFVTLRSGRAAEIHEMLKKGGVSVRLLPGGLLRVTAGSEKENETFLKLLESAFAQII
jgi:histidinol-phosphate aminotransferase